MSDYMQEAKRLIDELGRCRWAAGTYDGNGAFGQANTCDRGADRARAALLAHIERGRVPEGMTIVPETASAAMLRPFYACPPEELQVAWQAALLIAQKQARVAAPAAPGQSGEVSAFPERDASRRAEAQGLFRKFDVCRVDGSSAPGGKHHGCEYFVLDIDHDPHAPAALMAYAQVCAETHPQLSADLVRRYGSATVPAEVPRPDRLRGAAQKGGA